MSSNDEKLSHGSLFSGMGGFDLASEWMGWENVFHCEWNDFGKRILKYYWPKAISYDDITKTDFTIHRGKIDILTGGFPCQPYSAAGKRKGKEDDRHLWPEMLRAIQEIQPTWIVGENVLGLVNWNGGLVFDEVQADLEAEGYEVQPYVLPAVSVDAPHRRDRVWFVAYRTDSRAEGVRPERQDAVYKFEAITNAKSKPSERLQSKQRETSKQEQGKFRRVSCQMGDRNITNNKCIRSSWKKHRKTESRFNSKTFKRFGWQNFPTQSPVRNGDDGLSSRLDSITFPKWRNESIKAGGNAIVPQVVYQIFKAIEQYNKLNN